MAQTGMERQPDELTGSGQPIVAPWSISGRGRIDPFTDEPLEMNVPEPLCGKPTADEI